MNKVKLVISRTLMFLTFFFILTVCLGVSSDLLFNKINSKNIFSTAGLYGDLYELTHLRNFKELNYLQESKLAPPRFSEKYIQKGKNLYIMGDSFTKNIDLNQFIASKTTFIRIGVNSLEIELDKTKKNILVIQNIERGICDRLRNDQYETTFMGLSGYYTKNIKTKCETPNVNKNTPAILKDFGVANIEDRLQFIFFGNKLFDIVKEIKAKLNFEFFERVEGGHIVSNDGKFLFYNNEANIKIGTSSFYPLKNSTIEEYSANTQKITKYYRSMGFDEVFYVFVPNKVSICSQNDHIYNHQIERLQQQNSPLFKTINIYSDMINHPEFYHKGDGHWNNKGMALFVQKINNLLKK
jgi:hypothetical protein